MILNVRHIGIVVTNLGQAIKFYRKLGFKICNKGIVTKEQALVLYGSDDVSIHYIKMLSKSGDVLEFYKMDECDEGKHHIALTVKNIKKAWKFFLDRGLTISFQIVERNNHKLFFAQDPWLNRLELVEEPK